MVLANYQLIETIGENGLATFFRVRQSDEGPTVILKTLKQSDPSPEQVAWFCQEYALLQELNLPGAIAPQSLQWDAHQPVMLLEDRGGQLLQQLNYGGQLTLSAFLRLAIALAQVLEQVHSAQLFHQDLNPANLMLNPETQELRLIDFSSAAQIASTLQPGDLPKTWARDLSYISPEQTGRTSHGVDYRTDFYSLGVILYELLTGAVPFQELDPLEVIHSHMARQPVLPSSVAQLADGQAIPAQISRIVLKLLKKDPSERYQSVRGLLGDLSRCDREFQATQQISDFALAEADENGALIWPNRLYGRQGEREQLLTVLSQAGQGKTALQLVAGEAGVGKSALIQSLKPGVIAQQGLFLTGKYDQYQQDVPYRAFIQALDLFCGQVLSAEAGELEHWQGLLRHCLGGNAALLCGIVPRLALILGRESSGGESHLSADPLIAHSSLDNSSLINLLFEKLFATLAEACHPLVVVLDDLQWADGASLKLIHHLVHDSAIEHLVLIGAYRPEAVAAIAPLSNLLQTLYQQGESRKIQLHPLAVEPVNELLAETLACDAVRTEPLARLIHGKTQGNPFFVLAFLKSLQAEGLLTYGFAESSRVSHELSQARWDWDMAGIAAQNTTANVVNLMVDKLYQLPDQSREMLQRAACLGHRFNLADVAAVQDVSPFAALAALLPAIHAGLVMPLNEKYRLYLNGALDEVATPTAGKGVVKLPVFQGQQDFLLKAAKAATFRFQHDRIQEAVYSDIEPGDRQALHYQIGQVFLARCPATDRAAYILKIVNHLNQGASSNLATAVRLELAQLNLEAGQKAARTAAHEAAARYFEQGLLLCGDQGWEEQYDLTLALHDGANAAACLTGQFEHQAELSQRILAHSRHWQDSLAVTEMQMQACIAQRQFVGAITVALAFLKQLDIDFPEDPQSEDFQTELVKTLGLLQGESPLALMQRPTMDAPEAMAVLRILHPIHTALYMATPTLFPLAIFKEVQLSLQFGHGPLSAPAYVYFGLILCGIIGDIETGHGFGQLARQLVAQPESKITRAASLLTLAGATVHWKEHLRETLPIFQDGYQSGVETGDFQSAAFCRELYCSHSFLMGVPLDGLIDTTRDAVKVIAQLHQASPLLFTQIYQQIILNLADPKQQTPWEINGEICQEEPLLEGLLEVKNASTLGHIYVNKLMLCYWFGQYDEAEALIEVTAPWMQALTGTIMVPLFHFYTALTLLAQYPQKSVAGQELLLEQVKEHQDKLKTWSQFAPMNYGHKWALVEAERLRLLGQSWEAMNFYEQAIQGAREQGYLPEEAIACEQAARLYSDAKYPDLARYYLKQAYVICQRWQAQAKLKQLERTYEFGLLAPAVEQPRLKAQEQLPNARSSLDLASILKASQALSGEIELDALLSRLMAIVLENAGAERGALVLLQGGEKAIFAEADIRHGVEVLTSAPRSLAAEQMPMQVVHSVIRSGKSVMLEQACESGEFTRDPYIVAQHTQSLLCTPLLSQGKVIGLLYLENNLTP